MNPFPAGLACEARSRSVSCPAHYRDRKQELGADLYIKSKFDSNFAKVNPLFRSAIEERDKCKSGTSKYSRAQDKVDQFFDQLYCPEAGYWRDPYNSNSLFGQLEGLSWWNDVCPRLDDQDQLHPPDVAWLLNEVRSRRLTVQANLTEEQECASDVVEKVVDVAVEARAENLSADDVEWFLGRKFRLVAFLEEALRLNKPVVCSL